MTLKRFLILTALVTTTFNAFAQYNNIEFIENKGQWDSRVRFKGEVSNGAFFLRDAGVTIVQHNTADLARFKKLNDHNIGGTEPVTVRSHAWNIDFVGASLNTRIMPEKSLQTYNNYFIGDDPSKWAADCRIFYAATMKDVYPGIDVRYFTNNGYLKYDIIVNPGADASRIALKYDGINKLQVKNKELVITTSLGEFRESYPYTYQPGTDSRTTVDCKYVVRDNIVRFDIKDYDRSQPLVIDPSIIFCTFSGSTSDNWGFTATYGPDGSMFGGGIVRDLGGFPVSPGAFQTTWAGGTFDIGIIKLTPDGSNRVYATYIGGSGEDQPHSLIVDNQGNLVLAGRSNSGNYPVRNNGTAAGTGYDIVVTKLNAQGNNIIGSRRIGGSEADGVNISASRAFGSLNRNYGDDGRSEVILDGAGNIYVASSTSSTSSTSTPISKSFPVTAGAYQTTPGTNQDGVVMKFSPDLNTILFSTFIGGSGNDAAYVLSLAPNGNIYVSGGTESANLFSAASTAGTVGPSHHNPAGLNPIDGYVAVLNNNGSALVRATFIGTSGIDQVFGIQFDSNGFPYIMGQTTGSWQVINAAYSNAGGKQFISKLQPDLSAFVYSTMFGSGGSTPNISPIAFLVDRCENVYISGWGGFIGNTNTYLSAGTNGLPVTPDAFKSTTDGKDFYFFVLEKNATRQLFGSFFGENNGPGAGVDHVDGGTSRFDRNGVIYQAICGNCKLGNPPYPSYPVTFGSWSTTNNANSGAGCNLTMLKVALNLAGVAGGVQSSIDGNPRDTAGCVPLTVDFIDTIGTAQSYEWHFNYVPGNPPDLITTTPVASFTYTAVGTYQVMLVAVDPNTCNVRDSSFMTIRVGDLQADLGFTYAKTGSCNSLQYLFTNISTAPPALPFSDTAFAWDFGDGSPIVIAGLTPPLTHTYANPGTYNVILTLRDTGYCNYPISDTQRISVAENVVAAFSTPASGCLPYFAEFDNNSVAGETWLWDFGDGGNSTDFEPVHLYATAGTYTVVLIAYNANTCNLTDTTEFTITVYDSPVPAFTHAPIVPVANTPVTFTNNSSPDAVRFRWDFGDGDSLITTSRAPVSHQYNATGTFDVCLTAYNEIGCDSTVCAPVEATIIPLVDVPNAFTPNSGDVNSIIKVQGFGIAKMQFMIWNRWGQKVFESTSPLHGWDGRVKGVVQPMDVYAYTLSIEFFDGTKTTKKGDITLIR